ncbi:MAG: 2-oxoglutarate synthase, partial [Gammaproteobacteria bacterium]|nr:2-oxoglutarate synthase [Gammaproteobacteria bacterium]
ASGEFLHPRPAPRALPRRAGAPHGTYWVTAQIACLHAGRQAAAAHRRARLPVSGDESTADPTTALDRWVLNGNEATGFGALAAGVRFCAAYPITPATEILEWLAGRLPSVGGRLVQAEDELASINMCIGAAYGGVPALTATSGPGLSLMIESLGLAVAAEIPLVVANVMRGGPSTGIPTKSEQTDLNIAVYGLHGEAPHVVVAPTGIGDCAPTAAWAVTLAEALQTPVILLSDQALGQTRTIADPPATALPAARRTAFVPGPTDPPTAYRRYAHTPDGVSPMSCPGMPGGQYTADGLTHTTSGVPSTRAEDHVGQLDKRRRKLEHHDYGARWGEVHGDGALAVITWGSATHPAREACDRAAADGLSVRLIALRLLSPLPVAQLEAALAGVRACMIVEHSHTGQFYRHLRAWAELPRPTLAWHRPGPLPLRPGEILEALHHLQAQQEVAA